MYTSDDDNIPRDFYNPILKHAVQFDRTSAYFSAKALAQYSEGLEFFEKHGRQYRLVISEEINQQDYLQIKEGYKLRKELLAGLIHSLSEDLSLEEEKRLSNLAYFLAKGVVEIKFAFREPGIFHDKCGIFRDKQGDVICFRGSNNETEAAIQNNYESFSVFCSWLDVNGFYKEGIQKAEDEFEKIWNNQKDNLVVLPAEKVIVDEIIKHNKGKVIVEKALLRPNTVVLDYDGQLLLHINADNSSWIESKTFYKTYLKHKIQKIANDTYYFKTNLTYRDFIKIDELLNNKIPSFGYGYCKTDRLIDYIEERNIYIEKRAKLGTELKLGSKKFDAQYQEFKKIVEQSMERRLREKQAQDAFFMCAMTKSGNFSVPGSGKTSSALAVFSYLNYKGLVDRIVMIGPKSAFGSWIDEFDACFGKKRQLHCFNIQDEKYKNSSEKRAALKYDTGKCNLFLINYESLPTYKKELESIISTKTLLVFDEVHKVKAVNGQRAAAALDVAKHASYTIAMTGTPIPNSYVDIYNLLHILFNDEYEDFFGFDTSMLVRPSQSDVKQINTLLQPFFCRTTKKELGVPDANKDTLIYNDTSYKEQRLFEILCQKYRNNQLALFIRILQLETNPNLLLETLDLSEFQDVLEVTDDIDLIDFVDYSDEVVNLIKGIDVVTKKKACIHLAKDLVECGKPVVIWCVLTDSIKSLSSLLKGLGIKSHYIMGEVPLSERQRLLDDFRKGEFEVLITNPHTLAESVSLHSVCHDAIYYEYSYNLVHLLQSKDRIHRLGLPTQQYTQYYFLQNGYHVDEEPYSLDERVYLRLLEKEQIMLDAIDKNVLEPTYTTEDDLRIIFNKLF